MSKFSSNKDVGYGIEGFTSLMQEYDIPHEKQRQLRGTLFQSYEQGLGPIDAQITVEDSLGMHDIPGEFFKEAHGLLRKSMNESNLRLLVRSVLSESKEFVMSENLLYHHDAGYGVDRNIFRPGSTEFFNLFREARRLYRSGMYTPKNSEELELLDSLEIGNFAVYEGCLVPLDYPIMEGNEEHLNEAEYKGKKVELNKPKRGGEKGKAYVYVNSGKKNKDGTIRVRKVSFGSSMPDAMGSSEEHKKRRKSFGDRHNCADKDDKTKPGYWSCRLTKFFGRDIPGWW